MCYLNANINYILGSIINNTVFHLSQWILTPLYSEIMSRVIKLSLNDLVNLKSDDQD